MQRLGEFNLRYRVPILVVTGLLTAGSLVGWYSLRVSTDLISFFPERSPIRTRIEDLHRSLAGGLGFYIVLDTGRPTAPRTRPSSPWWPGCKITWPAPA
jgi:predicted RND superfamily exporter protein